MRKLMDFFERFTAGELGYDALKEFVIRFNEAVYTNPDMENFAEIFSTLAAIMPYITVSLMFLFIFFGKKILPVIKFAVSFIVGFGFGVYLVAPLLNDAIGTVPSWVSGLLIAILASVLYRLIYIVFFALAAFFGVYTASFSLFSALGLELTSVKVASLIVIGIIGVVIAFLFRKYVEMLATSLLGAFVMVKQIDASFFSLDYEISLGSAFSLELTVIIATLIAIIGFWVQFRTRRRY